MTELRRVFRIATVPRFHSGEADARLYDVLVGQRTLWGHVAMRLLPCPGAKLELRLACHAGMRRTRIELRFYATGGDARAHTAIEEAAALLPVQYEWEDVTADDSDALPWNGYMARLRRRLDILDLPVASPMLLRGDSTGLAAALGLASEPASWERQLPGRRTNVRELAIRRFCLPLLGPVEEHNSRPSTMFDELRRIGAATISFCVHAMDRRDHLASQQLALNWKRFLDPFAGELASAGFASVEALRHGFDRFALPSDHLLQLSMRVAAESAPEAVGLANVLAATLGGQKAFRIEPPSRLIGRDALAEMLISTDDDIPNRWTDEDRRQVRADLREALLSDHGVREAPDDELLDFMALFPNVFTVEEASQLLRLPIADEEGLPGLESRLVAPFTTPAVDFIEALDGDGGIRAGPHGRLRVGLVQTGRASADPGSPLLGRAWHSLEVSDLAKHALVVGSTGSGKTMTTLFLVRELDRLGVPVMIVEPVKTEYYGQLRGKLPRLKRYRLEGSPMKRLPRDFLRLDPLRVPRGISVARHASYLKSCFQAAFPLTDVMALVLESGLLAYYTSPAACGFHKYDRGDPLATLRFETAVDGRTEIYPSFATFSRYFLETYIPAEFTTQAARGGPSQAEEWRDIFRRRFKNLAESPVGDCFRAADDWLIHWQVERGDAAKGYDPLSELLREHCVIELDAAPDGEHKALLMAFLLTYVYERRQGDDYLHRENIVPLAAPRSGLRHMLILEEAHRLLASGSSAAGRSSETVGESSQAKAVGLFVDMLAEIRAYGQGMAIVEQIPTKIIPEAVKNTNLKIMLRLTAEDDRRYLGAAMNFSEAQMRFVNNLKIEKGKQVNLVCFEEGVDQPILLSLPLLSEQDRAGRPGWLYDEFFDGDSRKEER